MSVIWCDQMPPKQSDTNLHESEQKNQCVWRVCIFPSTHSYLKDGRAGGK